MCPFGEGLDQRFSFARIVDLPARPSQGDRTSIGVNKSMDIGRKPCRERGSAPRGTTHVCCRTDPLSRNGTMPAAEPRNLSMGR